MYNRSTYRFVQKTDRQSIAAQPGKNVFVTRLLLPRVSVWGFRMIPLILTPFLLAGCVKSPVNNNLITAVVTPEQQVTDYRIADCDLMWDLETPPSIENALYWLRLIGCSDNLTLAEARNIAKHIIPVTWDLAFKQSILLSSARPTLAERRKMVENLNKYRLKFPNSLRPLLQLWREQQVQQIAVAEEREKFHKLQSDTDNKIDRLRESRAQLEFELQETARKLENLTDIERQLSSRKQNQNSASSSNSNEHTEMPATSSPGKNSTPDDTSGSDKGAAQ
ncbi:two-component system QseEF-associated lipoprotein QseG [Photorhabdus heterorhabditis]|uniref:two-component system QseEF-associated lipoprotein QseG n=1 Tax=Photorhabdus heterorhabditis TaxID=880156 RepID=UPI001561E2F2|nr:two-component system QseEF-associated lipoprotein QseG [Photorhabdus heterorhabditis]NRN29087.1 two-component system QseEF-associated lipoprotein QseG [Photorhabdus heterorhabditis subsp. aluminescens]